MKKCKITVLKVTVEDELIRDYGAPGTGACGVFKEGQEFITSFAMPRGFCPEAWRAVQPFVFALAHGADMPFFDEWVDPKHRGVAIVSCSDGLRPVIFKVEPAE